MDSPGKLTHMLLSKTISQVRKLTMRKKTKALSTAPIYLRFSTTLVILNLLNGREDTASATTSKKFGNPLVVGMVIIEKSLT
jgi:hypothetical protein